MNFTVNNLNSQQFYYEFAKIKNIYIMSEEHKMTKQDKLVLAITLAAIFLGVFALGLFGLIVNLSS